MKRPSLAVILFLAALPLFSLDFSIRPRGFAFFPVGGTSAARFGVGGGGDVMLDLDFATLWPLPWTEGPFSSFGYGPVVEAGFAISPLTGGADDALQHYSAGLGAQAFFYPQSRLLLRLDTALGAYRGILPTAASPGFWWRGGLEAGFRLTPSFTVSSDFGFRQYRGKRATLLNQGIYAGLSVHLTLETGGRTGGINLRIEQDDPVYPVFSSLYQENRVAVLRITNSEDAEIRNVRVSFRAGDYTSSELNCGSLVFIGRGMSGELPLYADFSPNILNFTESGRISGEVVIRYTQLGRERQVVRGVSVQVNSRNLYPLGAAGEMTGLSSFVSTNSPEVLEFSRYVMGLARTNRRTGLNANMQSGIWLFESLRAIGFGQRAPGDPAQSAAGSSLTVQFPAQTLAYRSGSIRDIALLYSAVLEASGISAGFIPLEEDYLVAFNLGIGRDDAVTAALFNGPDKLLILGDEVWLPLAVSKLDQGFTAAWTEGVARINAMLAGEEAGADFIALESGWIIYPPASLPSLAVRISRPAEQQVTTGVNTAITRYIISEFDPKIRDVTGHIALAPTASLYNQLGNLYLRTNRAAQAKTAYEEAIGLGSLGAMINRGNVALNERDWNKAEQCFSQALDADPENAAAMRGMEQVALRRGL